MIRVSTVNCEKYVNLCDKQMIQIEWLYTGLYVKVLYQDIDHFGWTYF